MQALGSQGVPQARSRHLRGRRRDQAGTESRRQVRSRSQSIQNRSTPTREHHVDVFEASHLRDVFWQSGSKKAPLTPRPPFPNAGCTTACTWTASPSPSRTSPTRRTSTWRMRRDEALPNVDARPTDGFRSHAENVYYHLLYFENISSKTRARRLFVATFVASSPAKAAARERSGDLSRTPRRVADRAPIPDPATGPRARRARRPRTPHPAANRAARGAPATGRPATPAPPALAR